MRDLRVEQWLRRQGIGFEYDDAIDLAAIEIDKETKENIRLTERIDEDLVIRYGVALENGAIFPAIVVIRLLMNGAGGPKRLVYKLITGVHRTETFRLAGRTTIPAYIADVSDKLVITVLRRTANNLEGKPPSLAELLEHALYVHKAGYNVADAARACGVPHNRLQDRVLLDGVQIRLASLGVPLDDLNIADSGLKRLSQLRDRYLKSVVEIAHAARLSVGQVEELGRQIREAESDQDRDKIITEWRARYKQDTHRNAGGAVRDPASGLRAIPATLRQVERAFEKNLPKAHTLRAEEIDPYIGHLERLITILRHAIVELKKAKEGVMV